MILTGLGRKNSLELIELYDRAGIINLKVEPLRSPVVTLGEQCKTRRVIQYK